MQVSYYQAAWGDIKHSPGWFGKVCLLGLIGLIPVFGPIVIYGYAFGWARDMAWNVHRPMPERIFGNEDGKLYSRGFFAWLIVLVIAGVVPSVISYFAGDNAFWSAVVIVAELFLSIFALVGVMRMAIYGRLSAGFQLGRMWSMARHDANGLLRILGMVVLVSVIGAVVFVFGLAIVIGIAVAVGIGAAGAGIDWLGLSMALNSGAPSAQGQLMSAMQALAPVLGIVIVLFFAFVYALSVFDSWVTLLQARAMGYWTRQFDVPRWRGQGDPMPFEVQGAYAAQNAEAQWTQQAQQGWAQQPGQYQQYQQPQSQQPEQPYASSAEPARAAAAAQPAVAASPSEEAPAVADPAVPAYAGRPSSTGGGEPKKSPVAPRWEKIDLDKLDRHEGDGSDKPE